MAAPKRNKLQLERDRELIGRLYVRGKTQQDITNHINEEYYPDNPLSRPQIAYDIRLLIERWKAESTHHIDQRKGIELQKINDLELVYRDAWERSLLDAESTVLERNGVMLDHGGEIVGSKVKQIKKREGQSGNPAFLAGIMNCINRRCEILGLDAPKNQHNLNVELTNLTDDQLKRLAAGEDLIHVLTNAG